MCSASISIVRSKKRYQENTVRAEALEEQIAKLSDEVKGNSEVARGHGANSE